MILSTQTNDSTNAHQLPSLSEAIKMDKAEQLTFRCIKNYEQNKNRLPRDAAVARMTQICIQRFLGRNPV
jgi:hypothetical protein